MRRCRLYPLITLFLLLTLTSCKGGGDILKSVEEGELNYDKYGDSYENYLYRNEVLKLEIGFDSLWSLKTLYRHFDKQEKMYADFVAGEESELLFIGVNDEKKLGVRAVCERIALTPEEYFTEFKKQYSTIETEYNITYSIGETVTLKNIEGYKAVYEVKINAKNSFTYSTLILKTQGFIIRLDFWTRKESYEEHEEYIENILKYIDIVE